MNPAVSSKPGVIETNARSKRGGLFARARRDRFYLVMAAAMLLATAVGFAPTFYLRAASDVPALPLRLHVHGAAFTLWFILLLTQTILIEKRSVRLHRRLGLIGGVLAVVMVASGLVVLHAIVQEADPTEAGIAAIAPLIWGNITILAAFSAFVILALIYRRRPAVHKRLMLLASISISGQALSRVGQIGILKLSDVRFVNDAIYGLGGMALLLLILAGHDMVTRRRLHAAVGIGAPMLLTAIIVTGLVIPNSSLAHALILWFR